MDSFSYDIVAVTVTPDPEESQIISSPGALSRIQAHGLSSFCELLIDMFPSGFSVSAFDADGAIIIHIIDGPGFRIDDDGEWGGRVALQAFNEALQFLNAG